MPEARCNNTDRFSLSVHVSHALSRLHWPQARVRRALANNRTKITGPDGHPSFAPLIQGKYSIEPWSDALAPRWEAVYEPQSPGCWPGPAVHVGMEWDSWFVGVAAAQWPPEKSPALRLEFSRRGW